MVANQVLIINQKYPFELPSLQYSYDALEPYIDAKTMEIHYTKHHQGYVNKLNEALQNAEENYRQLTLNELLEKLNELPETIKTAVRNMGGGHYNHSFFWPLLKKDVEITETMSKAIEENFGSFENFKQEFFNKAVSLFGSGWTWLVMDENKKLLVVQTQNQDNPLSKGYLPLLGIDVWEHAYYLKYQNRRNEYVENFFNVINWETVEANYKKALELLENK